MFTVDSRRFELRPVRHGFYDGHPSMLEMDHAILCDGDTALLEDSWLRSQVLVEAVDPLWDRVAEACGVIRR